VELHNAVKAAKSLPAPPADLPEAERRRIRNDRLRDVDITVMAELLGFRRRDRTSVWCSKRTIAARIGVTAKTVQMSFRRLESHGFIRHVAVGVPDPEEPQNKTGWRIELLFVPGARGQGQGPDRRPPEERRRQQAQPGVLPVSSLPPAPAAEAATPSISSGGRKPVSPAWGKRISSKDGVKPQEKPQLEPARAPQGTEPSTVPPAPSTGDDEFFDPFWGGRPEAVEAVRELLGDEVARQLDTDHFGAKIGGRWDCLHAAAHMAQAKRGRSITAPVGWLLTVARDYAAREDGIPPEATRQRESWLDSKHRNEQARRAAEARAEAEAAASPANDQADLEQLLAWASGSDRVLRRFAQKALARNDDLPPEEPAAAAARADVGADQLAGDFQPSQLQANGAGELGGPTADPARVADDEHQGSLAAGAGLRVDRDLSRRHAELGALQAEERGGLPEDRQQFIGGDGASHSASVPGPAVYRWLTKLPAQGAEVSASRTVGNVLGMMQIDTVAVGSAGCRAHSTRSGRNDRLDGARRPQDRSTGRRT
jgi:hypothetical protein